MRFKKYSQDIEAAIARVVNKLPKDVTNYRRAFGIQQVKQSSAAIAQKMEWQEQAWRM